MEVLIAKIILITIVLVVPLIIWYWTKE